MELPYHLQPGEHLRDRVGGLLPLTIEYIERRTDRALRAPTDPGPCDRWYAWGVPTINQIGPSCDGEMWCNIGEMLLRAAQGRSAIPAGYQLDGHAAWRRGREMFWDGDLNGGLMLGQGIDAMVDLGWLPRGSTTRIIPATWSSINAALLETPVGVGSNVDDGWSRFNGYGNIDESLMPDPDAGHAWPIVGTHMQRELQIVGGQMSWGRDYADHGWFYMSFPKFQQSLMPSCIMVPVINGDLTKWIGFRKGLVKRTA